MTPSPPNTHTLTLTHYQCHTLCASGGVWASAGAGGATGSAAQATGAPAMRVWSWLVSKWSMGKQWHQVCYTPSHHSSHNTRKAANMSYCKHAHEHAHACTHTVTQTHARTHAHRGCIIVCFLLITTPFILHGGSHMGAPAVTRLHEVSSVRRGRGLRDEKKGSNGCSGQEACVPLTHSSAQSAQPSATLTFLNLLPHSYKRRVEGPKATKTAANPEYVAARINLAVKATGT